MRNNHRESLSRLMSIEDLLRLQEAHAAVERQRQEEEKERAAEEARQQEYLYKRLEIIEQINLLQKELERMGGREMEERILASQELKAREEESASELEAIKVCMDEMQDYIGNVQGIIARSEHDGTRTAPQIIQALSDAGGILDDIMQSAPPLIAEIALLQSRQLPPEEMREFQWVKEEIENLTGQLGEIEKNPSMSADLEEIDTEEARPGGHNVTITVEVSSNNAKQKEPEISESDFNSPILYPERSEEKSENHLTNERIRLRQALTNLETEMENAGFFALDRKRQLHESMETHQRDLNIVEELLKKTGETQDQVNTAIF